MSGDTIILLVPIDRWKHSSLSFSQTCHWQDTPGVYTKSPGPLVETREQPIGVAGISVLDSDSELLVRTRTATNTYKENIWYPLTGVKFEKDPSSHVFP